MASRYRKSDFFNVPLILTLSLTPNEKDAMTLTCLLDVKVSDFAELEFAIEALCEEAVEHFYEKIGELSIPSDDIN